VGWNGTMSVFGYVFLSLEKEHLVTEEEQRAAIYNYAQKIGSEIEELVVEEGTSLKQPLKERIEGSKLLQKCLIGDSIIIVKAEWILGSAGDGATLLQTLRQKDIALHCIDFDRNISVDEKRKLIVSEGCAGIIRKVLSALAVCERSSHGQAIRETKRSLKNQGKYIGGPVPFGWEVNKERVLVQNDAQQKIIQAIITMREERWSYRDIATKLKEEFDVQLSHAGVRRILETDKKKKETQGLAENQSEA
jgi:DNA invertase Pin-like site-specific DNA recombinase